MKQLYIYHGVRLFPIQINSKYDYVSIDQGTYIVIFGFCVVQNKSYIHYVDLCLPIKVILIFGFLKPVFDFFERIDKVFGA
jgi:hypothetical protein